MWINLNLPIDTVTNLKSRHGSSDSQAEFDLIQVVRHHDHQIQLEAHEFILIPDERRRRLTLPDGVTVAVISLPVSASDSESTGPASGSG